MMIAKTLNGDTKYLKHKKKFLEPAKNELHL